MCLLSPPALWLRVGTAGWNWKSLPRACAQHESGLPVLPHRNIQSHAQNDIHSWPFLPETQRLGQSLLQGLLQKWGLLLTLLAQFTLGVCVG